MRHPLLTKLRACDDAQKWASKYETLDKAWAALRKARLAALAGWSYRRRPQAAGPGRL